MNERRRSPGCVGPLLGLGLLACRGGPETVDGSLTQGTAATSLSGTSRVDDTSVAAEASSSTSSVVTGGPSNETTSDTDLPTGAGDITGVITTASDDTTDGAPAMCRGLDVLFVVGNGNQLAEPQTTLSASAPEFVRGLLNDYQPVNGIHIGVIPAGPTLDPGLSPMCRDLGTLTQWTQSHYCGPLNGDNHLQAGDAAAVDEELTAKLACLVGQGDRVGPGEQTPRLSTMYAVDPGRSDLFGCNRGFLRDDALLVLVFLLETELSGGPTPQEFVDALEGGGQGTPRAVAAMGLLSDRATLDSVRASLDLLSFGGWQNVLGEQDYAPALEAARPLIEAAWVACSAHLGRAKGDD